MWSFKDILLLISLILNLYLFWNQNQQTASQYDLVEAMKTQRSIIEKNQTQVNILLKSIRTQMNEGMEEILAKTQLQINNLQLIEKYLCNYYIQYINSLQTEKSHLSQRLEIINEGFVQVEKNLSCLIIEFLNLQEDAFQLSNTDELKDLKKAVQSMNDTLREDTTSPVKIYCDINPRSCSCNTRGEWMRIANLDMTDPRQQCPDGFLQVRRTESPLHVCGRPEGLVGCVSTTYPVYGMKYSRVCGRIIGYQIGPPVAFDAYKNRNQDIDGFYIDGISITHGHSPRQHIWSFVGAVGEQYTHDLSHICSCTRSSVGKSYVPPFVGEDYFCDTAVREGKEDWPFGKFYPDDPLWDGQGCGSHSTCCSFNTPPWFCKQLPEPTTDDIELRLCDDQARNYSETPFEVVELYIN